MLCFPVTIKTEWAPTPLTQIDFQNQSNYTPDWIIPKLHTTESEDGSTQHAPIKPKTRFLFYNGLQDCGPKTKIDGI